MVALPAQIAPRGFAVCNSTKGVEVGGLVNHHIERPRSEPRCGPAQKPARLWGVRAPSGVEVGSQSAGIGAHGRPSRGEQAAPDWPSPGPGGGSPVPLKQRLLEAGQAICQSRAIAAAAKRSRAERPRRSITAAAPPGTAPPVEQSLSIAARGQLRPKSPYRSSPLANSGLRPGQAEAAAVAADRPGSWNGPGPLAAPAAGPLRSRPS